MSAVISVWLEFRFRPRAAITLKLRNFPKRRRLPLKSTGLTAIGQRYDERKHKIEQKFSVIASTLLRPPAICWFTGPGSGVQAGRLKKAVGCRSLCHPR